MRLSAVSCTVDADYHQFSLVDPDADRNPSGDVWDGPALARHLAVCGACEIVIGTASQWNFETPVAVEVWDGPPEDDVGEWDHVVEASIEACKSRLHVMGFYERKPAAEIELPQPGAYRVRVAGAGLEEADTGDEGGDRYRIQVWPAPEESPAVVKAWPRWDEARARPHPTPGGGRLLLGAEAEDAKNEMRLVGERGEPPDTKYLYRADDATFWELTYLPEEPGQPHQLEELRAEEASHRYGRPVEELTVAGYRRFRERRAGGR